MRSAALGLLILLLLLAGAPGAAATEEAEPPPPPPFGRPEGTIAVEPGAVEPGAVELSTGETVRGALSLTRDKPLEIYIDAEKKSRRLVLGEVRSISWEIEKEAVEKEWRWKEAASDEKVETGNFYVDRKYRQTIALRDGTELAGHLKGTVIHVTSGKGERRKFLLLTHQRGAMNEPAEKLVYVKAVRLGEAAEEDSETACARRLVRELGDDDWHTREAASKELATLGMAALPRVEAALESDDVEVKKRAESVVAVVRRNAQKEIRERALVKDLLFCGPFPFDEKEKKPLDLSFTPENEYDAAAVLKTGEVEARWSRPFEPGARGVVDLDDVFGKREHTVVYALASVRIADEAERKLLLLVGSDDSVRVWVNGKPVHTNEKQRGVRADEDAVEVTLAPGWNDVLLKVANFKGAWGLALRLAEVDKARSEPKDLTWDPTRGGERKAPALRAPGRDASP